MTYSQHLSLISHVIGLKKVLLVVNESGCSITQIAVMQYCVEDVVATVHHDLLDNFYIFSGECDVVLNGKKSCCKVSDFIFVPLSVRHASGYAITGVEMLAMRCVIAAERRKLF